VASSPSPPPPPPPPPPLSPPLSAVAAAAATEAARASFLALSPSMISFQDCLAIIPPYPFYIGERDNNYDVAESLLLESWNRKAFTGYTSPHLFPLSTLEGLRTSSAEFHLFHAFWTEIHPQLFHISTAADRRTLLSAAVDGAGPTSRRGSHVYEFNTWLWNFGRPQPRVGGLSVAKTDKLRRKSRSEASKRGWATKRPRK
jgi:hypothetical protein